MCECTCAHQCPHIFVCIYAKIIMLCNLWKKSSTVSLFNLLTCVWVQEAHATWRFTDLGAILLVSNSGLAWWQRSLPWGWRGVWLRALAACSDHSSSVSSTFSRSSQLLIIPVLGNLTPLFRTLIGCVHPVPVHHTQ